MFYIRKIIKEIYHPNIIFFFGGHSLNMSNTKQNNEIKHINKEINLLQDLLKKNEKSLNQFQYGLMRIKKIRIKKRQRTNLSKTKKIQNIVKNISQNKIKQIKKNANLLQNTLAYVKRKKDII